MSSSQRDGGSTTAENSPSSLRQVASPSRPWMQSPSSSFHQIQRENHRVNQELINGFMDSQTLESSFGRLSVFDSNGGGVYHREIPESQPFKNDSVNRSYGFEASTSASVGFRSGINKQAFGYTPSLSSSIVWLAKDKISSKHLREKIDTGSKETVDMIFDHLLSHICDLMVDPFAHHVILKLLEKCSSQQITHILRVVTNHHVMFVRICVDSLGSFAIQSLLKCLCSEEQIQHILGVISIVALTLTRSNNAKHVILQCFKQFSPSQNRNLIEVIARYCYRIATDQNGCCMLQQCLGLGCAELKNRLVAEIINNALKLCVDSYGNYVVQYVLALENRHLTVELVRQLIGHYGYLSRNKYGSHAVEKFLQLDYIDSRVIVYDLLREIDTLLLDPFGNYVIQTAWFVSKDEMRDILWCHIQSRKPLMSCNKFGRKLLQILDL